MSTTQVNTEVLAQDVAEAVDRVAGVEAEDTERKPQLHAETPQLAKALAALPKEQRQALAKILSDEDH